MVDLEHRDPPVGIDLEQELGGPRLVLHDVIFAPLEMLADDRRRQPHLVAIARGRIFVEDQPLAHSPTSSTILPTWSPASIRACASAAWVSGKTLSITGFNRPPST